MYSSFYIGIGAILAFNTFVLGILAYFFYSPRFAEQRISERPAIKAAWPQRLRIMAVISVLSLAAILGGTWLLFDQLVHAASTPWWRVGLEALGILVLYDFLYYWLHRSLHHKKLMRFVHGVHHRARNPSALESFYLHPIELLAGLGLLLLSTMIIGPVHSHSFLLVFFVYSTLNIVIHSGMDFPVWWMAPLNFLTRKHHVHHQDDFAKNYSSLTPLPDLLFGTAR